MFRMRPSGLFVALVTVRRRRSRMLLLCGLAMGMLTSLRVRLFLLVGLRCMCWMVFGIGLRVRYVFRAWLSDGRAVLDLSVRCRLMVLLLMRVRWFRWLTFDWTVILRRFRVWLSWLCRWVRFRFRVSRRDLNVKWFLRLRCG